MIAIKQVFPPNEPETKNYKQNTPFKIQRFVPHNDGQIVLLLWMFSFSKKGL
jgi:hypothetical protein